MKSICHIAGLRFEEIHYATGLWMPSHTHRAVFLDFCLEGTSQEFWQKQSFVRGNASLTYVPEGAPHGTYFPKDCRNFQIVLLPQWLERIQQYGPLTRTLDVYEGGGPTWTMARLYREFQQQDSVAPLMLEGLLLELLAQIARQSAPREETGCPRWLRQAEGYLRAHFTENLSLETVATLVDIHPSHLMRSFRQYHNCTMGDYIRRLRVEYACHLLTTSEEPAAQIALTAGFADQSHFNRTFKGITGMTPTEFQKVMGRAIPKQPVQF